VTIDYTASVSGQKSTSFRTDCSVLLCTRSQILLYRSNLKKWMAAVLWRRPTTQKTRDTSCGLRWLHSAFHS